MLLYNVYIIIYYHMLYIFYICYCLFPTTVTCQRGSRALIRLQSNAPLLFLERFFFCLLQRLWGKNCISAFTFWFVLPSARTKENRLRRQYQLPSASAQLQGSHAAILDAWHSESQGKIIVCPMQFVLFILLPLIALSRFTSISSGWHRLLLFLDDVRKQAQSTHAMLTTDYAFHVD